MGLRVPGRRELETRKITSSFKGFCCKDEWRSGGVAGGENRDERFFL